MQSGVGNAKTEISVNWILSHKIHRLEDTQHRTGAIAAEIRRSLKTSRSLHPRCGKQGKWLAALLGSACGKMYFALSHLAVAKMYTMFTYNSMYRI